MSGMPLARFQREGACRLMLLMRINAVRTLGSNCRGDERCEMSKMRFSPNSR
jgi:hypothetical protein